MKSTYTFLSEKEPTDKQLENLMKAVLVDVKKRSELGRKKLAAIQVKEIKEAKLRFKNIS
jgi:hypothetical protein